MHPVSGSHQSCSKRGLFVAVLPGHLLYLDFLHTYIQQVVFHYVAVTVADFTV